MNEAISLFAATLFSVLPAVATAAGAEAVPTKTDAETTPLPKTGVEIKPSFAPPPLAPSKPMAAIAMAEDSRFGELQKRVGLLEQRVNELEETNRYRYGTVGLAGLIGGGFTGGIETDLKFLFASYYFGRGFDVGLRIGDDIARVRAGPLDIRVRLDILDIGAMIYVGGGPLTVPDVHRTWDLSLKAGVSVHLWKGITIRGRVAWFLPNPGAAIEQIDASVKEAADTLNPGAIGTGMDRIGNFYGRALAAPKADIAILWAF